VIAPNQRTALAALDAARPIVARLDIARDPEDIAADILEAWSATETALRSLIGGSSLTGQPLIRELRQRELLSLEQAHGLLEFLAARDRCSRPSYRPTSGDIAAARDGFQKLEDGLSAEPPVVVASQPAGARPALNPTMVNDAVDMDFRPRRRMPLIVGLVVLLVLGGAAAWYFLGQGGSAALQRGIAAYRAHSPQQAAGEFTKAAHDDPRDPTPHIFLARIARDEGNLPEAVRELQTAIQLDPKNATAMREMGAAQFVGGNYELARAFYARAVQGDPTNRDAQGYLGCSLIRLGRFDEGMRWINRAGSGAWSSCAQAPPAPLPAR
jgi:cytochrome c-type biogenesis protein CcmH/NrfG